ncbi:ATP-binding protein [Sphaerisporangium perillae]|uniref:ATP-binding protein n=1 Tax=Sphaerisporangium perillae TaxID=2935860 RepID=UPI00200BA3FC|nr:ATP-binding protein [Sphaerisporangium perillae]
MADPVVDIPAYPPRPGPGDCFVPTGKMVWRRAFTGVAEEAPKARAFVRCLLAGTRWVDDAEFAIAELVSNSLFHSRSGRPGGYFVVELTRRPRSVRVGVYDLGGGGVPDLKTPATPPRTPTCKPPDDLSATRQGTAIHDIRDEWAGEPREQRTDELLDQLLCEHGRGLDAVTRLASRVGCRGNPVTGHLVWALFVDATPRRCPS